MELCHQPDGKAVGGLDSGRGAGRSEIGFWRANFEMSFRHQKELSLRQLGV